MTLDLFAGERLAPDAPAGLAMGMIGGGDKVARRALDFYPTPAEGIPPLLIAEAAALDRYRGRDPAFWEPCGRGGAIQRAARPYGLASVGTDIVADPAHDVAQLDLRAAREALAPAVLSNFPWAIGRELVAHLWGALRVEYMALLFKATWMHCDKGAALERAGLAPTRRWDMTFRLDFAEQGNPVMNCTWYVWDRVDTRRGWGLIDRAGPVSGGLL